MLIASFQLDHEAVALEQAFEAVPDMDLEADRVAAHSAGWTMPCLWVAAADFGPVDDALATDPTVDEVVESEAFDHEKFYQVDWTDEVAERVHAYIDHEGSILSAEASREGWELRFRFATRDQFDQFREALDRGDRRFELIELTEPSRPRESVGSLTPAQRDALVAASDHGYFEVPRAVTTRELAAELDTSHQALSELLRRGTGKLVEDVLVSPEHDDEA